MHIEIVYAGNDSVTQTQQVLSAMHRKSNDLAAILSEPVGTGMLKVAEAAASRDCLGRF